MILLTGKTRWGEKILLFDSVYLFTGQICLYKFSIFFSWSRDKYRDRIDYREFEAIMMGGLRAAGIYCQYTLTLMRLGKGNCCFGTLRSEGRTPPGGCPQSGCPQTGSCPKTWEEVLTSHQHLTHGFSGAHHFKRWCSISNVLRQYWPKFVQREVKASLLHWYLWRSEQPLLGLPRE